MQIKKHTIALVFCSIFMFIPSGIAFAAPGKIDDEAYFKINNELAQMGYDYSQYIYQSIDIPVPEHTKKLSEPVPHEIFFSSEVDNPKIRIGKIIETKMQPMEVDSSTLTNHTDRDMVLHTQEYEETHENIAVSTTSHTFGVGASAAGTVNIILASLDTSINLNYDFNTTESQTKSVTKTYKIPSQAIPVPAGGTVIVKAVLNRGEMSSNMTLSADLNDVKVPVGKEFPVLMDRKAEYDALLSPFQYWYKDGKEFIKEYHLAYDADKIPKHEFAKDYRFDDTKDSKQIVYDGGYADINAVFGTHLSLEVYDVTDGEEVFIKTIEGSTVSAFDEQ
ncbi:ETX/MTX2 family pore-forming toxin [Enterococcus faecalis]|nr:ETX/MTX2 family pore-forming toxin [Enterococcus faecalis]